jgi:uncharacterized protein YegP (UPF0339 family)
MSKYLVYKDRAGLYRWRFVARNGQIIADSAESYTTKTACLNGIRIMKTEGGPAAPVEDATGAAGISGYGRW